MRRVGLCLCWILVGAAWAQESGLRLRCRPGDAEVWLQRPGYSAERVGKVGEPLALPSGGGQLILRRSGWQDRELPVPAEQGEYPPPGEPPLELVPGTSSADRSAQAGYYLGGVWPWALLLGSAGGAAVWWRSRRRVTPAAARVEQLLAQVEARAALTGTVLGGYRLLDVLGEGGMGQVYRGLAEADLDPARPVAVKVLHRELSHDWEYRKRFLREAQICQTTEHPGLVKTLAFGEEEGLLFLVMEVLQGKSVADRLDEQRRLSVQEATSYVLQAMEALDAVHRNGIVHRDLKPENLFITDDGRIKVTDFGVARGESFTVATATGLVMGTPEYMAPEQVDGEVNPATDQYALGVMLFELLAGKLPYDGDGPEIIVTKHLEEPVPSARLVNPEVSERLDGVVRRLMAKEPRDRYPSMQAAAQALRAALGPGSPG